MTEVDTTMLSRALKILDRSVRAGEDLDPFPSLPATSAREKTASPRKSSSKKSGKASNKLTDAEIPQSDDMDVDTGGDMSQGPTTADFDNLTKLLDVARDSILAADCCIALLGSDRLQKQVRSPFSLSQKY
jgi:cohesin loading factor subunit SCC2